MNPDELTQSSQVTASAIDDIHRIFYLQRLNHQAIKDTTAADRAAKLRRLSDVVHKYADEIVEAVNRDFSRPKMEVRIGELTPVFAEIEHCIRNLKRWMRPVRHRTTGLTVNVRGYSIYEPKGVALIIAPWNFPVALYLKPVIGAVIAGNCFMAKPSSKGPETANLLKRLIAETFPEDEGCCILGNADVGQTLLELPFDHMFFTGSPETGAKVMTAAAKVHASVNLELGGKSPAIIDESADIEDACQKISFYKFFNNGQACVSVDYLLVQEDLYAEVVKGLKRTIIEKFGDTEEARMMSPDYGRLANNKQVEKAKRLLDDAVSHGAKIEIGGVIKDDERYCAPTILSHVSLDSEIMKQEIFAPMLPVIPYKKIEQALLLVNALSKPLTVYVFSHNKGQIDHIIRHTSAGMTSINEVGLNYLHPNMPFGGVNKSGMGHCNGIHSFHSFSNERGILKETWRNPLADLIAPPYTKKTEKIIRFFHKYMKLMVKDLV